MDDVDMFLFDLGCAFALLLVAALGSYLPLRLYSGGGRSLAFQLGSMFSGGVMLSAGLCHLLADSLEDIEEEVEDFPLGPFLCCCGFLATLVIDQIGQGYFEHNHDHQPAESSSVQLLDQSQSKDETGQEAGAQKIRLPISTAFLLALALVFHSVMEGLGLGTEEEIESSIDLAIAILAHKGMAGYALGACVIDSNAALHTYWTIMGIFTIASPIGVMVGYAISEFSDSLTSASFTALASGTFLYVALMEVIPNELKEKGHKVEKLLMLILGFGLMSIVAIWA